MSQRIPWTGSLPRGWRRKPVKHIASLKAGDAIESTSINEDDSYPVYGGNGIRGYTSAFTHSGDHVLIGRQGALCGNINYASGRFWASEHAVVASILADDNYVWLGELLRAMNLNQYSQSAAQPGISINVIGNLEVPVPPAPVQRSIAEYLGRENARIDRIVEANLRLIAALAERLDCQVFTLLDKGNTVRLGQHLVKNDGGVWGDDPSEASGYPVLRSTELLADGTWVIDQPAMRALTQSEWLASQVHAGDIVVTKSSGSADHIGKAGAVTAAMERRGFAFSNFMQRIRCTRNLDPGYLTLWLNSSIGRQRLGYLSNSTTGLANLSAQTLRDFWLTAPGIREQKSAVAMAGEVRRSSLNVRQLLHRHVTVLVERRGALIEAAVTGQLEIPTAS